MQDSYDNYDPNQKEIKDIYAEEIDKELTYHFPVEVLEMEKQLKELFSRKISKKEVISKLMKLVDRALDVGDREEFDRLCEVYRNIQVEFKYY